MNFERMNAHGDTSKDVLLQEGDIVYVPPTVLAAAATVLVTVVMVGADRFFKPLSP